jgi:DNA helicase-2/ATP-dependent DNA helicase PcrA
MGRLKPTLILGGPGCGKTTRLLEIVEQAFSRGVEPDKIAFVAFTRKAAQEARERMVEKFGVEIDAIPYFRTLHSFAFKHIDAEPNQILSGDKLREYAKAEGLDISSDFIDEFGQVVSQPSTDDERALSAISLSQLTLRPLDEIVIEQDLSLDRVAEVKADYEEFKEDAILFDFTDMLQIFVDRATLPTFDLLIVDEAQDLSALQWQMVDKLVEHSKDVYFAGDDDQAIYTWAGADIAHFLNLDADREVLPISYRLKREVFEACQKVIHQCDERYPKDWEPHAEGGEVDFTNNLDSIDMSEGSWFLLARTNSLVRSFTKYLRAEGRSFWLAGPHGMESSVSVDAVQAVLTYENLRKGRRYDAERMRTCWAHIAPKLRPETAPVFEPLNEYGMDDLRATGFNADGPWFDVLSIPGAMQDYIRMLRATGESLIKPPRITVSTIHGVKGGEADNVVVWQKLSGLTFKNWLNDDPQEVRALFTAMSRAKERLIFLDATTAKQYHVERIIQ